MTIKIKENIFALYLVISRVSKQFYRFKSINCCEIMANSHKIKLSERLSLSIRPSHYQLLLNPDMKTGLFQGNVKIDVNLEDKKNFLSLHTKFLDINDVKVFKGVTEIPVIKFLENKYLEQLLIQFDSDLSPGNYQLSIKFNGNLTRNIVGIYLSHLKNNR